MCKTELFITFDLDRRYELRGEPKQFRNGTMKTVWRAYFNGFPVYEIMPSVDPDMVRADLSDWLKQV